MAFAEVDDVEIKLKPKLGRAFTEDETAAGTLLLDGATAVIAEAVQKAEADLDPDTTPVLKFVAIELVGRLMANPLSVVSEQESLGAYSYAARYMTAGGGLELTKNERAMVRRAVHGRLSGSSIPQSIANDECVLCGLIPRLCGGVWLCGCDEGS